VRLLVAQVEIALAAGDLSAAASALEEAESVVRDYESASLHAMVAGVRGALRVAEGNAAEAMSDLRDAQETWRQINAPHEVAELSLVLAEAHRALGNEDAAVMDARAARDSFQRLGARPGAERAAALLGELGPTGAAQERVKRAFMFTDIVKSTDLVGVIGDEAWEDLLAWHDETLRSLFASHGGEVAHHTGDGFFVAFESPRSALTCAVAIQRALAEHRRAHGFAPLVRIGVHAAEGIRRGLDYSGGEVHKAARIAAAGDGGEILASDETLAAANGEFAVSEPEEIALKGIAEPVRVARIEWRSSASGTA
jgi:class 3 adenylate cyclase